LQAAGQAGEYRMAFTHSDSIAVKRIKGKGRGVFARRLIQKGEVIERVPMIVMSAREYEEELSSSCLSNYCFAWGRNQVALALGYGSIYNHSYSPNARYEDVGPQTKVFIALRAIQPGEEITVNYNGEPRSRTAVWFKVIEANGVSPQRSRAGLNGRSGTARE
jgi:SET domain-containing protein